MKKIIVTTLAAAMAVTGFASTAFAAPYFESDVPVLGYIADYDTNGGQIVIEVPTPNPNGPDAADWWIDNQTNLQVDSVKRSIINHSDKKVDITLKEISKFDRPLLPSLQVGLEFKKDANDNKTTMDTANVNILKGLSIGGSDIKTGYKICELGEKSTIEYRFVGSLGSALPASPVAYKHKLVFGVDVK
ncbi:MAG: hypothetical protein LBG71_00730 [Clostridiales Family XIII bacterium]|nr:hypothetical protein [Clostridiales Family XIII bacterium]